MNILSLPSTKVAGERMVLLRNFAMTSYFWTNFIPQLDIQTPQKDSGPKENRRKEMHKGPLMLRRKLWMPLLKKSRGHIIDDLIIWNPFSHPLINMTCLRKDLSWMMCLASTIMLKGTESLVSLDIVMNS